MKSILPLLLFMLFLTACDADIPPAKMTSGEQLYGYYCRECHTYRGPWR